MSKAASSKAAPSKLLPRFPRRPSALSRLLLSGVAAWLLLLPARPAAAQQLVDGSQDGDLAFIGFALTCFAFLGLLIVIDRLRPDGRG